MAIKKLEINGCYTFEHNCESVEVLEFKTIILKDDSYQNGIEVAVYVDEDSSLQCMEIIKFANMCA